MSITISNCEKAVDKQVLENAYKLFRDNKVVNVTNIEVNEHIGSLYEGKIKIGRLIHTLCFAISIEGYITVDECFCNATGEICEHYLAIFLYLKYKKNIIIDKRVFSPVRVILSSAESSPEGVSLAVDTIFNRYIVKNKISEWYMLCAIEGLVFACMCAEAEEKSFAERVNLYGVAFSKVDRLFTLSTRQFPRMLVNHAKGLIKLANNFLIDKLPKCSLIDCKPAFFKLYDISKKARNWVIKYNILGLLIQFCDTPSLRIFLERDLKKQITAQNNEERKSDLRILYCMVLRSYSLKLASTYIEKNLSDVSFRRMAIDLNIANGEFGEARKLAKEGLVYDKGNDKNTLLWIETMYDIGEHCQDTRAMKAYAKKMLLMGDFDYYLKYKNLFGEEEWTEILTKLIAYLKNSKKLKEMYLQIIIEEDIQEELVAFCQKNPEKISSYYPYINVKFYKQIESYLNEYCEKLKKADNTVEDIRVQEVVLDKLKNNKRI